MSKPLIDDALWAIIEPLIPVKPRRFRFPGRKRLDNRRALTGIVFVLKTGIGWEDLPQEMDCGSGMTCWRRLRDWEEQGVWLAIWRAFLGELNERQQLKWSESFMDGSFAPAKKGALSP